MKRGGTRFVGTNKRGQLSERQTNAITRGRKRPKIGGEEGGGGINRSNGEIVSGNTGSKGGKKSWG